VGSIATFIGRTSALRLEFLIGRNCYIKWFDY
jgi:hypothetical protein